RRSRSHCSVAGARSTGLAEAAPARRRRPAPTGRRPVAAIIERAHRIRSGGGAGRPRGPASLAARGIARVRRPHAENATALKLGPSTNAWTIQKLHPRRALIPPPTRVRDLLGLRTLALAAQGPLAVQPNGLVLH